MKTLKSIVVALSFAALACGPDSVNHYYGGKRNNNDGGSYTCDDFGEAYVSCVHPSDSPSYSDHVSQMTEKCVERNLSSECVGCVVNGPCESDPAKYVPNNPNEDPVVYCKSKGICPNNF